MSSVTGARKGKQRLTKTIKFVLKTGKKERAILNKLTARHTFVVFRYLEIITQEELVVNRKDLAKQLDQLTVLTARRPQVRYDLKKETGLSAAFLQQCRDTAIWMMRAYESLHETWEKQMERASQKILIKILCNTEFSSDFLRSDAPSMEEAIDCFSRTWLWRRLQKNEPNPPLQSHKYRPKKIPIQFDSRNMRLIKEKESLFVSLSTLQPYRRLKLELEKGAYQEKELQEGTVTGGKVIKNNAKNRWEFHATLRKSMTKQSKKKRLPRVILGIDLGIAVDATVVALVEGEPLKQNRFFFLKEGALRKKKFNLVERKKVLQKVIATLTHNKRNQAIKELKNIGKKLARITKEACHRISRKVAEVVQQYVLAEYEVHVAVGQLKGIRFRARKGNEKGKKYRGKINRFPFHQLSEYITYKAVEVGATRVATIRESWTSRTCHKCASTNTCRPTQAQFICRNCGLHYNADANAAINIALRYWSIRACNQCHSLTATHLTKDGLINCSACQRAFRIKENKKANRKDVPMIFLLRTSRVDVQGSRIQRPRKSEVGCHRQSAQGTGDAPPRETPIPTYRQESAGRSLYKTTLLQVKVEEARKRKTFNFLKSRHSKSDELYGFIAKIIHKKTECSMVEIQGAVHKLWLEGKLSEELIEVISWKKPQPYSHFLESSISTYVLRGRIRQTEFGNYKLSQYGQKLFFEKYARQYNDE